ncbi:MAG: gliding motility protein GldM [Saprospiraceae bacterium]|nr:gliding motility protein GldM [Saprospiraceae bacterium]MDP4997710.1 gliding motility protein GldM [Saprospiraceae bacterium]
MSIPKEPRQLMINLMYLVLTALLALNVSAEVMNAFFTLDKGIKNSNDIVQNTNQTILNNIQKQAQAYDNDQNKAFLAAASQAEDLTEELVAYVEAIKTELYEAAGGDDPKHPGQPKRIKDKDVTTRMFVGDTGANNGKGFELEKKIRDTRDVLLQLVDNDPSLAESIPLKIDETALEKSGAKSWTDYNFKQMPVAAVFPLLTKIQNDAKASATAILNHFLGKVSGEEIKFDAFEPVISARKGYIIRGETYNADIFLSAYSTSAGDNTRISVNGANLPVKDGKAVYNASPDAIGAKKYNVKIDVTNPLTGEIKSYAKEFEYEVGERSVAVSADKMNVFYIGVDNPVSVSAAGISSNELSVSIDGGGGTIKKVGSNNFVVNVTNPGDATINVAGGGMRDSKLFRVKRIPNPEARLSNSNGGNMGSGEFKAQAGVGAFLDNFDFDAKCSVVGYELVYAAKRADVVIVENEGARYTDASQKLVAMAKPGDTYYFNNVRASCPGDKVSRKINSMVFTIR